MTANADVIRNEPANTPTWLSLRARGSSDDEFEMWRWSLSPMFEADVAEPQARQDFQFVSHNYICGNMSLGTVQSSAAQYRRRTRQIARSGADLVMMVVYGPGGVNMRAERKEAQLGSGDIAVLDLNRETELSVTASASMTCLLPRQSLEDLTKGLDQIHGMIIPSGQDLNELLRNHMKYLFAHAADFTENQSLNLVQAMAHLLAASTGPANLAPEQSTAAAFASKFRQVRQLIEANLTNPDLGPTFLTNLCKLSRSTLYRMFEPVGGIAAYIQQRRLMRAHRDLNDPALFYQRVNAIAKRWGFTEHSAFSRAYKQQFDMAPSEARALARQGYSARCDVPEAGAGSFQTLNRWLLGGLVRTSRNTIG
jgi:AraC-like DNA-binding protein